MEDDRIVVEPVTSSIGARITGVDLRQGATVQQLEAIRRAVLEHLVVFLPGQHLDEEAQAAFARSFGEPRPHPEREYFGDDSVISTIESDTWRFSEDANFHTDMSNYALTPDFAILAAMVIPERGGDTLWANLYEAYDALSPTMRDFLGSLSARHGRAGGFGRIRAQQMQNEGRDVAAMDAELEARFPKVTHPVVCVHPITKRPHLFVNRHFTKSIVGLEAGESAAVLGFLFAHCEQPRFCCRYRWSVGDVAVWDEHATLHQAQGGYWPASRQLRRVTVGSVPPRQGDDSADADDRT
jgi:taurine dioxygenase